MHEQEVGVESEPPEHEKFATEPEQSPKQPREVPASHVSFVSRNPFPQF